MIPEPRPELDARFSGPDATPTPWPQVRDVLERAELFWISTVRDDGRPHVTPLPAVWFDNALHFCTGAQEQKGVNLARNPSCTLTTGNNAWNTGLDIVVEGRAERVDNDERLCQLAALWFSKYNGDWDYEVKNRAFHHDAGVEAVEQPTRIGVDHHTFARSPRSVCSSFRSSPEPADDSPPRWIRQQASTSKKCANGRPASLSSATRYIRDTHPRSGLAPRVAVLCDASHEVLTGDLLVDVERAPETYRRVVRATAGRSVSPVSRRST